MLDYVRKLMEKRGRSRVTAHDIGIITPYKKQVQKIKVLLRAKGYEAVQVRCRLWSVSSSVMSNWCPAGYA